MSTRFGPQLLHFRLRTRALQKQIALTAGIDGSYLAALERGRRPPPTSEVIERLSESLALVGVDRAVLRDAAAADRLMATILDVEPDLRGAGVLVEFLKALPALSSAEIDALISLATALQHSREGRHMG